MRNSNPVNLNLAVLSGLYRHIASFHLSAVLGHRSRVGFPIAPGMASQAVSDESAVMLEGMIDKYPGEHNYNPGNDQRLSTRSGDASAKHTPGTTHNRKPFYIDKGTRYPGSCPRVPGT